MHFIILVHINVTFDTDQHKKTRCQVPVKKLYGNKVHEHEAGYSNTKTD